MSYGGSADLGAGRVCEFTDISDPIYANHSKVSVGGRGLFKEKPVWILHISGFKNKTPVCLI